MAATLMVALSFWPLPTAEVADEPMGESTDVAAVDVAPDDDAGLAWDGALDLGAAADRDDDAPIASDPPVVRWTDQDVRDSLVGRSVMVRRIVFCEVGRSGIYDPYAIGGQGEIGPAQLLPGRGNGLAIFYGWGFTEPNNPWQAVGFIERVIAQGMLGSQYPRTQYGCDGSI